MTISTSSPWMCLPPICSVNIMALDEPKSTCKCYMQCTPQQSIQHQKFTQNILPLIIHARQFLKRLCAEYIKNYVSIKRESDPPAKFNRARIRNFGKRINIKCMHCTHHGCIHPNWAIQHRRTPYVQRIIIIIMQTTTRAFSSVLHCIASVAAAVW